MLVFQDDGWAGNDHHLSVAGKIKKHFNTGPKASSTTAGVSVITVRFCMSHTHTQTHTLHYLNPGCITSNPLSRLLEVAECCFAVLPSQTTALDKERQVFQRRPPQEVITIPHTPHSSFTSASPAHKASPSCGTKISPIVSPAHRASPTLSPAEFTSESEDYSPSSAETIRSPTSPF